MYQSYVTLLENIGIPQWFSTLMWPAFLFAAILFVAMFFGVVVLVLMERRVLALLTVRKGPNRVGYDGALQTIADGIKIMFKEDIMAKGSNKVLFTLAPVIVMASTLTVFAVIPYTKALVPTNIAVSLLFVLAISSISTIGLLLAGWASNNKYSLIGGIRSAAQAISYEIPLIIAAIGVVVLAGTMNLSEIIATQKSNLHSGESIFIVINGFFSNIGIGAILEPFKVILVTLLNWNLWYYNCIAGFIGFIVFFICAIAESNRIPFDLPEAESELVSGYSTEYSGIKFAMFFMAEYAALFVIASLTVILFLGGYLPIFNDYIVNILLSIMPSLSGLPFINDQVINTMLHLEQAAWFTLKVWLFIFIAMWIRATLPRLRADQMMAFCWKFLLPLALINLLVVTIIKEFIYRSMT
jgi:NADH-quinone oxidoreductase subunit H